MYLYIRYYVLQKIHWKIIEVCSRLKLENILTSFQVQTISHSSLPPFPFCF